MHVILAILCFAATAVGVDQGRVHETTVSSQRKTHLVGALIRGGDQAAKI